MNLHDPRDCASQGETPHLIGAHTNRSKGREVILHQANRLRDDQGRIIATLEDYVVVRGLVSDLISEGVEVTVELTVRETVKAVEELSSKYPDGVSAKAVGEYLKIDKSAAYRRCKKAIAREYLKNNEERPRRPARLVLGDPMPENATILPDPKEICWSEDQDGCTVDGLPVGIEPPPPQRQTQLSSQIWITLTSQRMN